MKGSDREQRNERNIKYTKQTTKQQQKRIFASMGTEFEQISQISSPFFAFTSVAIFFFFSISCLVSTVAITNCQGEIFSREIKNPRNRIHKNSNKSLFFGLNHFS